MNQVVRARGVSKNYGKFQALDQVDLTIEAGSIVGLIGPNGAGKTTLLKSMLGLTDFAGDLSVLDSDPRRGRHKVMENVCFIADVGVLPRWLKVSDALDYVEGVHHQFDRARAEAILADTKIGLNQRIKQLSKGMVTQLHLALVMAVDVELLVLDEPTLGLDILYRKTFYERLVSDYFDHETSIVISTHQVEEIESLLTHLVFIREGRIILSCDMESYPERFFEVLVDPDRIAEAQSLNPIYSRKVLGRTAMLFDSPGAALDALGEISTPSVADLFVATMQENSAYQGASQGGSSS